MSESEIYLQDVWLRVLDILKKGELVDHVVYDCFFDESRLISLDNFAATIMVDDSIKVQVISSYSELVLPILSEICKKEITYYQVVLEQDLDDLSKAPEVEPVKHNTFFSNTSLYLNPAYTFDNFIVGPSNAEAYRAAVAASSDPGKFYNPLFIYGGSGLGKTHLLQSIANYITDKHPNLEVLVITADDFVEVVCNPNKDLAEYKTALGNVDVFLVDDVQFLADKKKSDEIFFHIFNELVNKRKQIVLTSDRAPHEIRGLESRLVSRFSTGLPVSVSAPEFETAVKIIKSKIETAHINSDIDDNVIDYLAANFSSDVRLLEGTLNRLIFNLVNSVSSEKIDLAFAIKILKDSNRNAKNPTINSIKNAVNEFYGLTKGQLEGKSRTSTVSLARHIAIYLCRKYLEPSYKALGKAFGYRDHSTIINACDRIESQLKADMNLRLAVTKIEELFLPTNK